MARVMSCAAVVGVDAGGDRLGGGLPFNDTWAILERPGVVLGIVCGLLGRTSGPHPISMTTIAALRQAFEGGGDTDAIRDAITSANRDAIGLGRAGLGTTVDAVLLTECRADVFHVGDGCVYRARQGDVRILTTEHTLANDYRRHVPDASEEEVAALPKDVIVRAVGMSETIEIDCLSSDVDAEDVFLICSGALHRRLEAETIRDVLCGRRRPDESARALLDRVGQVQDDATVVLLGPPR